VRYAGGLANSAISSSYHDKFARIQSGEVIMRCGWLFLGLVLLVIGLASSAIADEPPDAAKPHKAGDVSKGFEEVTHEESNIFKGVLDLGLWTIVIFVVLVFVLRATAWKPMLEGLQKREDNIHGELDQAQKANAEAQAMRAEFEKKMNEAQQQVRDLVDQARKDGEQVKADMVTQATSQIQAEKDRARREIQTEKEQALVELFQRSTQLATLVSAKAIRRQMTIDDQHRLVEEALNDLGVAANDRERVLASIQ
jgi:F-type H+-transporting ATPase subunit b